jgi:hypothetical protein
VHGFFNVKIIHGMSARGMPANDDDDDDDDTVKSQREKRASEQKMLITNASTIP